MIARIFEHRSDRVIALCRAVLALVFFAALWIDPSQPVRSSELGYALLGSYLAFAAGMLLVAIRSWWLDHRLAWFALAIDIGVFLAAVYFTEGVGNDFTSPFLAFFAFLMLAATIRWDWRVTALTGIVVTLLYLSTGLGLNYLEIEFDGLRFGRRVAYMLVLTLILIWFGLQRREQHVGHFVELPRAADGVLPPLAEALAYAMEQSSAPAGAIAWEQRDEPDVELRAQGLDAPAPRLDPHAFPTENGFGQRVRLFSADRRRRLLAGPGTRPVAEQQTREEPLADLLGVGEALALPITSTSGRGELILAGISGINADHVGLGALLAREIAAGFDRHSALVLSRESALARTRDSLARDLHDSVAQSLAGAALRLEGLRKWIRAGHDPDPEIVQLKDALRAEQLQVRDMINRLRDSEGPSADVDLADRSRQLLAELSAHWGVSVSFAECEPLRGSASIGHEISHLLREAVANAVRHGGSRTIAVGMLRQDGTLGITVADDGRGFPPGTGPGAPRSIRERLDRLGGCLAVDTGPGGTTLAMRIPGERALDFGFAG